MADLKYSIKPKSNSKLSTIGDRVKIKYKTKELFGLVKFVGEIKGKNGIFYGVELDEANSGENNGSLQNIKYFTTSRKKGIFIKKSAITKTNAKKNTLITKRVSVGTKVKAAKADCNGIIRFIGEIDGKTGIWFGIELDQEKGKNNGCIKNRIYFKCDTKYGIFVKEAGFEQIDKKTNKKSSAPSTPIVTQNESQSQSQSQYDINRRKDIEKVVNVLDGKGSLSDLNEIITSYDDKKESEDIEWLKIIATLKLINDNIINLKKNVQQNNDDDNNDNNDNNDNEMEEKYEKEIKQLNDDKIGLEEEIVKLKDDKNEIERTVKFEKDELKQKYESQIRTLNAEKQRLQQQVVNNNNNNGGNNNNDNYTEEIKKNVSNNNDNNNNNNNGDKDEIINELKRDKDQSSAVIRAKDEIINTAKEEIKRLKKEIATMKEEEEKEELQLDHLKKDRARKLLQERVDNQQQNTLNGVQESNEKKKTISELLNESNKDNAMSVIYSMGVIKYEYDKKLQKDTYDLDLTNNSVLRRLTNDQRKQFMFLLAHCICDDSGQQKIEKVKMSNMGIDDKLFPDFMDILITNIEHFGAEEWWIESNKIGNESMKKLANFLELTPSTLQVIKMYNNKCVVSTPVINQLLTSIEKNNKLQKFTFEWRLTQHRDRIEKQMNKNQDLKRKLKWAKKK